MYGLCMRCANAFFTILCATLLFTPTCPCRWLRLAAQHTALYRRHASRRRSGSISRRSKTNARNWKICARRHCIRKRFRTEQLDPSVGGINIDVAIPARAWRGRSRRPAGGRSTADVRNAFGARLLHGTHHDQSERWSVFRIRPGLRRPDRNVRREDRRRRQLEGTHRVCG